MKIPPRGDEHNSVNNDSKITCESETVKRWPESGPKSANLIKIAPELQQIITAWPKLSEQNRKAILDIVKR